MEYHGQKPEFWVVRPNATFFSVQDLLVIFGTRKLPVLFHIYIYPYIYIYGNIYIWIYIYIYIEDDHQWSWYWGWDSHNSLVFHNDTLLGIEILFHYGNPILNLSNQYFMDQGKLALCRPKPAVAAHRPRNLAVGA